MKTVIFYLTRDGQTRKIAEHMATEWQGEVSVYSLRDYAEITPYALAKFDCIVIGASIRYGHFDLLLEQFIRKHSNVLNEKKTAFFSVNLTARKPNKNTAQTNVYTRKLLARITWRPDIVEVFAGALRYPSYRWFDRIMIRLIMKITGGETDARYEYEYTNWQQVSQFTQRMRKLV